ncbi:uncharacterized protein LOC144476560 [Augochlora pura]
MAYFRVATVDVHGIDSPTARRAYTVPNKLSLTFFRLSLRQALRGMPLACFVHEPQPNGHSSRRNSGLKNQRGNLPDPAAGDNHAAALRTSSEGVQPYGHSQKEQQTSQHCSLGWQREYLQELHTRHKWHLGDANAFQEGMLVYVRDEQTAPLQWKLGRIIAVHPGDDGIVRVATVRTAKGTYKRAIKQLSPLPMGDD